MWTLCKLTLGQVTGLALLTMASSTPTDMQKKVSLTAFGVVGGNSVLTCSILHTNQTMKYVYWYLFKSKFEIPIIYHGKQSMNETRRSPGKQGPFKNRNVTDRLALKYHKLVIHDTRLDDNGTRYTCAVKMSGNEEEVTSDTTQLRLIVPSEKAPDILDGNNQAVKSSNCTDSIPAHQVATDRVSFTCRAGGSVPAPEVSWSKKNLDAEIKHHKTISSRSEKFGIEVKEVTREIRVRVSGNGSRLECVVKEPDKLTGRQRTIHMCLQVVKKRPGLTPAFEQQGRNAILFIAVPVTALILQILWICCICKRKSNSRLDQEPKLWMFVLSYMVGHTVMGVVGFVVCTYGSKIILQIVVIVVILLRAIFKFIPCGIWTSKRKEERRRRIIPAKRGIKFFMCILAGWGGVYEEEVITGDHSAEEELVHATKHRRSIHSQRCRIIFIIDVCISAGYTLGLLLNIILGKRHLASVSVILLVFYIGIITCVVATFKYYWVKGARSLDELTNTLNDHRAENSSSYANHHESPVHVKEKSDSGIDCWKKICAEHYLRVRSKVRLIPWDNKVVDINSVYTTLAWVENTIRPDTTERNHLHNYLQIFNTRNGISPKRILARGRAGTGKTTFVNKVAVDWAHLVCLNGPRYDSGGDHDDAYVLKLKALLRQFQLVLALNLRQVGADMTFIDAVFSQIPKLRESEKQHMLKYIIENQSEVLIIMDGYDEYYGRKSDIVNILNTSMFSECCVVTTTRPWKVAEIKCTEFIDVHVEVVGFSEENLRKYTLKFFHDPCNQGKGEFKAKGLMDAIESHNLWRLATVPLVALFLCHLWKKDRKLPNTMTCLYTDIIRFIVRVQQRKARGSDNLDHSDEEDRDINLDYYKGHLLELGKLALQGLKRKHNESGLIFDCKEVKKKLKKETWELGFLSRIDVSSSIDVEARQVAFPHKSIQEYLAAYYAIKVLDDDIHGNSEGWILEYFDSMEKLYDFQLVMQFMCGLSGRAAEKILNHAVSIAERDPLIKSDQEKPGPVWIGTFQPHHFEHACRFTEWVLSCICENENKENIHVKINQMVSKISGNRLDILHKILQDSKIDKKSSTIKILCLCDLKEIDNNKMPGERNAEAFVMDDNSVHKFVKPVATTELTSFCLSFVDCLPGIVELSDTIAKMTNITSLCICEGNLKPDSIKYLFRALSHTKCLKYINFSGNLVDDTVQDLVKVLPGLKNLRALVLIRAGLNPRRVKQLCGALNGLHTMEIFDLSRNHIGDGVVAICEVLKVWPNLWRLKLQDCALKEGDLNLLARHLPQAIDLKQLYLSWNKFGSAAACLVECFPKLTKLEKVHLLGTSLSDDCEKRLHNVASKSKKLKLFVSAPPDSECQARVKEKRWSLSSSTSTCDHVGRRYHSMTKLSTC